MSIFNKHFWKFTGGFAGIIGLAIAVLLGFEFWQNYKQEQESKNTMKEVEQQQFDDSLRANYATGSPAKTIHE